MLQTLNLKENTSKILVKEDKQKLVGFKLSQDHGKNQHMLNR